jgi:hypothetical protein
MGLQGALVRQYREMATSLITLPSKFAKAARKVLMRRMKMVSLEC